MGALTILTGLVRARPRGRPRPASRWAADPARAGRLCSNRGVAPMAVTGSRGCRGGDRHRDGVGQCVAASERHARAGNLPHRLPAPRRLSIRIAVAAAGALGVALVYAGLEASGAPLAVEAVEGFLPLVAAWFVGDSVAVRRRYIERLAEQAEREREAEAERARLEVREERVRIARELHDVVAHTLAVITIQAGVGRRLMAKRPRRPPAPSS